MVGLESPRAREPAAAGLQRLRLHAHLPEQLELGLDAPRRLLMAMPPDERLPLEPGTLDPELAEELGEVVDVATQPLCVVVVRKQLRQLVLEHREAARLQSDDRHVLPIPRAEPLEIRAQIAFR